jgi:hypothetical protein
MGVEHASWPARVMVEKTVERTISIDAKMEISRI